MNATALQILCEYEDWWTFIEYCHQTFGMSNVDVAKQSALAKIRMIKAMRYWQISNSLLYLVICISIFKIVKLECFMHLLSLLRLLRGK